MRATKPILSLILALALYSHTAQAMNCGAILLRARQFFGELTNRPLMQEGLPIGQQLIAAQAPNDFELARSWVFREPRAPDPGFGMVIVREGLFEFIMSVPEWKQMTNAQLRPILVIEDAILMTFFFNDHGDLSESNAEAIAGDLVKAKVTSKDLQRFREMFPARYIPLFFWPAARASE